MGVVGQRYVPSAWGKSGERKIAVSWLAEFDLEFPNLIARPLQPDRRTVGDKLAYEVRAQRRPGRRIISRMIGEAKPARRTAVIVRQRPGKRLNSRSGHIVELPRRQCWRKPRSRSGTAIEVTNRNVANENRLPTVKRRQSPHGPSSRMYATTCRTNIGHLSES